MFADFAMFRVRRGDPAQQKRVLIQGMWSTLGALCGVEVCRAWHGRRTRWKFRFWRCLKGGVNEWEGNARIA